MGTTAVASPSKPRTVTKIVTQTTEVSDPVAEQQRKRYREADFWEVIGEVMGKPDWMVRAYRADDRWSPSSSPAENKLNEPFDESTIFQKWGGGRYLLWLYLGRQVMRDPYRLELEGPPRVSASVANHSVAGVYDPNAGTLDRLVMELITELRATRGTNVQGDVVRNALDLNKQALTGAADTIRTLNATGSGAQSDEDKWLDRMAKYKNLFALPAAAPQNSLLDLVTNTLMPKLLEKMLTPGDPLESIKTVGGIVEAVKAFGGGTAKTDIAGTFLAQIPMIGTSIVEGLKQQRLAAEAQERTLRIQRGLPPDNARVITIPPTDTQQVEQQPAPAAAPQAALPNQTADTQAPPQYGTYAWFLQTIETGILNPQSTGADLYEFVYGCKTTGVLTDENFAILTSNKETLVSTLRNLFQEVFGGPDNEHLKRILANPARLAQIVDEYMVAVEADRAPGDAAPPPAKPN